MREGSPSLTAIFVSYARAVGTREPELSRACQDPIAERLVPRPWSNILRIAQRTAQPGLHYRNMRYLSLGLIDHLALRTALIDRALKQALASGTRQVVLLGAGLDARAHRIRELHSATLFEVDHPSTQRLKIRKAAGLPVTAADLRYAPCDFERVSLDQALLAQGFSPSEPAVWIWEGVTMYLEERAVEGSLQLISKLSAPGSSLIATYLTPRVTAGGGLVTQVGLTTLAFLSEPVRTSSSPGAMAERLARHAFRASYDALPADAAAEFGVTPLRLWGMPDEHVVVAHKQAQ